MKALVIGVAGFVGDYLVSHLKNDLQWQVAATKLKSEEYQSENVDVFELDITNKENITEILSSAKPDIVFHLAAQSSVALSWKNPNLTVDINIKGTINVLDSIRELELKPRILLIGSSEEYGYSAKDNCPIDENVPIAPSNIYAATKAVQNMLGNIYLNAYGMDIIMVRAFNHIGPKQSPIFVVSDFCKQVAEIEIGLREPKMYVGNLSAKRDFTDVRDVVRAYGLLVRKGIKGETYNVGSGKAVSIQEILDIILSFSTKKIEVIVDEKKLRPVDIPIIEADVLKSKCNIGWTAKYEIRTTILDVLQYWRTVVSKE